MRTADEYKFDYEEKMRHLIEYFTARGDCDPGYAASIEFDETATVEEVVGYYISVEGDNALNQWRDNIAGTQLSEKDAEVTAILAALYS